MLLIFKKEEIIILVNRFPYFSTIESRSEGRKRQGRHEKRIKVREKQIMPENFSIQRWEGNKESKIQKYQV